MIKSINEKQIQLNGQYILDTVEDVVRKSDESDINNMNWYHVINVTIYLYIYIYGDHAPKNFRDEASCKSYT
jgi:hypothetical protein